MPPPIKKAKHLGDSRADCFIRKQKQTASKRTKERMRDAWVLMVDMLKEYSEIMMNKKGRVRTLEENKVVFLVIYHDLQIDLEQCTADGNIYGTGLKEQKLFRQT